MYSNQSIGYIFKRKDFVPTKVQNLLQELHIHLFEAETMLLTIDNIINKKLTYFDSPVGDWKCQIRTAMIINLIYDRTNLEEELQQKAFHIRKLIAQINTIINEIHLLQPPQLKHLTKTLSQSSIFQYLTNNHIILNPSPELTFASLCFFVTLQKKHNINLKSQFISPNKLDQLCSIAKKTLCQVTINYEQKIATKYGSEEEQIILKQIESKDIYSTAATFPSVNVLFKRMVQKKQLFVKKLINFCSCGGIQKTTSTLLQINEKSFIQKQSNNNIKNEIIMVIQAYQYPGSLEQLKTILNVPQNLTYITEEYYKKCSCIIPAKQNYISDLKKTFLAAFAQHPQFINGAKINFEQAGLINSTLYQEYKNLTSLPGCNINDMSQLHLDHCYPSTIADALKEDSPSILAEVTHHRKDVISHHDAHCPC